MENRTKFVIISFVLLIGALVFFYYGSTTGNVVLNNSQALIVSLDISSDQQKIEPGKILLLEVAIREPGGTIEETSIIDLDYMIKDSKGNIISEKKESGAIAVKQSEISSLLIPTNTKPGAYTAFVEVNYKGNTYFGSKTFEVVLYQPMRLVIALIILIIFIVLIVRKRKNKKFETEGKISLKKHGRKKKLKVMNNQKTIIQPQKKLKSPFGDRITDDNYLDLTK